MTHLLTYKTIQKGVSIEIPKIKGSKFIGHILPASTEQEAKNQLTIIQKQHHQATHNCFGYHVGVQKHTDLFGEITIEPKIIKASDDGEPSGTAAYPIKNVLKGNVLHNVLLVVTRYYGGTKLGVGGLVKAYTEAAKAAIQKSTIVTKEITQNIHLCFDYQDISHVMNYIEQNKLAIVNQKFDEQTEMTIAVNVMFVKEIEEVLSKYIIKNK